MIYIGTFQPQGFDDAGDGFSSPGGSVSSARSDQVVTPIVRRDDMVATGAASGNVTLAVVRAEGWLGGQRKKLDTVSDHTT